MPQQVGHPISLACPQTDDAAPAGNRVLTAVDYLKGLQGRRKPQLDDAPLDIVDAGWKRLVIDKSGHISQPAYTLCVLERLQDRLRRRDVYVKASERWNDPHAKLLHGAEWEAKRTNICRTLGHSTSADDVVVGLSSIDCHGPVPMRDALCSLGTSH